MRASWFGQLAAFALAALAHADDWPGWRGLDHHGVSASPNGPLHWSPERNVKWKTRIPGRGHSSPVVAGDRVLVTTAYHTQRHRTAKRVMADGMALLPAVVTIAGLLVVLRRVKARTSRAFLGLACWAALAGTWCHFVLSARLRLGTAAMTTDQRMEAWLLASYAVAAAALACAVLGGRAARVVVAALAVGFCLGVVFARPLPAYFDMKSPERMASEIRQAVAVVALSAVVAVVATLVAPRAAESPKAERQHNRSAWLAVVVAAFLLGVFGFGYPAALGLYRSLRGLAPEGIAGVPCGWLLVSLRTPASVVGGVAVAVSVVGLLAGGGRSPARWFVPVALCVAAFGFVERNFLFTEQEFVRAIVCLDRQTGKVRWVREGLAGSQPSINVQNSPATPTPLVHGGRAFAWFGTAGLMCTDLDGKLLWTNTELPFEDVYGVSASPVVADGKVIVYGGQPRAPYLCALDPASGRVVWRTDLRRWPGLEGQHRTPTVVDFGGKRPIAIWGWAGPKKDDLLRFFDAATGQMLWSHPIPACGETVTTIVARGSTLYLLSSDGLFAVSLERLATGDDPVVWRGETRTKGQYVASPVLAGGRAFTVSSHRMASCFDASTGKRLWQERLAGRGCFASPVAIADRVYFPDISGLVTVVSAKGEFRKLAENHLGEKMYASPALVDGQLFLRTVGHLWCIEEEAGRKP